MGWFWAIIVGLVLGVLAKLFIPGKQHSPLWLTIIFGMLGAVAGNAMARGFGIEETAGVDWGRHALQLGAAIVIVLLGDRAYEATLGKRKRRA